MEVGWGCEVWTEKRCGKPNLYLCQYSPGKPVKGCRHCRHCRRCRRCRPAGAAARASRLAEHCQSVTSDAHDKSDGAGQQDPGSACVGQQWPRLSLVEGVFGSQTRNAFAFVVRLSRVERACEKCDSTEDRRPPARTSRFAYILIWKGGLMRCHRQAKLGGQRLREAEAEAKRRIERRAQGCAASRSQSVRGDAL
ncbi:hypothetical protein N431DRAFT_46360 [Stipitochalara longipes BDJ]|nr:hypothetical protein N431DRAFT_46360 [Stipitochalara longipes BDJ]